MQHPATQKIPFYKTWVFWTVFLYLLFIFLYTLKFYFSEGKNVLLSSNELGDFLAGAFAPLAFFFLLLGYKQQSSEIQKNTQELLEQKKQSLLLSQPFFHFKEISGFIISSDSTYYCYLNFNLSNSRAICRQLYHLIGFEDNLIGRIPSGESTFAFINNDFESHRPFTLTLENSEMNFENEYAYLYLLVNYTDINDSLQVQSFKLFFKKDIDESYKYSHYIVSRNSYQNKN